MRIAATTALGRLERLGKPVFTTADAALHLGLTTSAASRALRRLAASGLLLPVRHGLWSRDLRIDPLRLPEFLTAPYPAYVSLLTALQFHGMISQLPRAIHVASLAPTRSVKTFVAEYSVHRLAPRFFGGFTTTLGGIRLASPEKALLDTLYLAPARSRLFAALPEVDLSRGFDHKVARYWIGRMTPGPRQDGVRLRLAALLRRRRTRSATR